jgi:hypothetical protein
MEVSPNETRSGGRMSSVYNPEADIMAEIERLELESREVRRRIEHARNEADKRVLNKQLEELKQQIEFLQTKLP